MLSATAATKKAPAARNGLSKYNAVLDAKGLSYSKFMGAMKKKGILIDRKILADLAEHNPEIFDRVVEHAR